MSFYSGIGHATSIGSTSWNSVKRAATALVTECVIAPLGAGGSVVVTSGKALKFCNQLTLILVCDADASPMDPVLTLFMWETEWVFENILNDIQNDPEPVPAYHELASCALRHNETCGNETGSAL